MVNVFLTPFEIRDSIKSVFPQGRVEGTVKDDVFTLKCILSDKIQPLYIDKAINALKFVPAIKDLFARAVIKSHLQREEELGLDIKKFSLVPPLSNWKLFQRNTFKEKGKKIEDLLIEFLNGDRREANLERLEQLGLAPTQIRDGLLKEDEEVFLNLCERIQGISTRQPEIGRLIFERFKTEYPSIGDQVETLFIEKERERARIEMPKGIRDILDTLKKRVIGQDAAADIMCTALCSDDRKNKNFLFVGPTGIGKTEMGKAVSTLKKNRFLMLTMNTFSERHSLANLFGSPQGYVGSQDKPHLVKELQKFQPKETGSDGANKIYEVENIVLLFDELEKSHSEVKQSLLTLFDEGFIQAKYTKSGSNISEKYVFRNSIFIATSNLYSDIIKRGFEERTGIKDIVRSFVEQNSRSHFSTSFSPEFLGRFEIVPFGPIPKGEEYYQKIIKQNMHKSLSKTKTQLKLSKVQLEEESTILRILEERLYGDGINIRKLQRFFEQDLNTVIYTRIASEISLADKTLVLSPHEMSTIGVKAADFVLGRWVDFSELHPVTI